MIRSGQFVILMRHGLAVESSEWSGDDGDRPLTESGRKKFRQAAQGLLREYVPTKVVTSDLVRSIQSGDAVDVACANAGHPHPHRIVSKNIGLSANYAEWKKLFLSVKKEMGPNEIVLVIGHEPGLSMILAGILGLENPVFSFKKSGVAILRPGNEEANEDRWELLAFVPPRFLREMRT